MVAAAGTPGFAVPSGAWLTTLAFGWSLGGVAVSAATVCSAGRRQPHLGAVGPAVVRRGRDAP